MRKYEKPKVISAEEAAEIERKVKQEKEIRRSLKRDGMTDEEIDDFFKMVIDENEVDWM